MDNQDTPNIIEDSGSPKQRPDQIHLQTLLSRKTAEGSMLEPVKERRKLKCVELMPGVKWYNLAAFLVLYMVTYICSTLPDSFMTFILRDPNYYNEPEDVLAKDLGIITTYTMIT